MSAVFTQNSEVVEVYRVSCVSRVILQSNLLCQRMEFPYVFILLLFIGCLLILIQDLFRLEESFQCFCNGSLHKIGRVFRELYQN